VKQVLSIFVLIQVYIVNSNALHITPKTGVSLSHDVDLNPSVVGVLSFETMGERKNVNHTNIGNAKRKDGYQFLTGMRFERLTVKSVAWMSEHSKNGVRKHVYIANCECVCGNTVSVHVPNLRKGATKSCGCLRRETLSKREVKNKTHGMKGTLIYKTWVSMRSRCRNTNNKDSKNYANRGIYVCERWDKSFENFYADMGDKPSPKHSIERIDNNGPYSPQNCKWATPTEQGANTRRSTRIEFMGRIVCAAELARICGFSNSATKERIRKGQTPEKIYNDAIMQGKCAPLTNPA
jgi:hypothetical protein